MPEFLDRPVCLDPVRAPVRVLSPFITAYSPGSTPDDEIWFDALFDNYTVWLDDRDTLPPG